MKNIQLHGCGACYPNTANQTCKIPSKSYETIVVYHERSRGERVDNHKVRYTQSPQPTKCLRVYHMVVVVSPQEQCIQVYPVIQSLGAEVIDDL